MRLKPAIKISAAFVAIAFMFALFAAPCAYAADAITVSYSGGQASGLSSVKNVNSWLQKSVKKNGGKGVYTITLNKNVRANAPLEIPAKAKVVLNLEGFTFNRGMTSASSKGHAILVKSRATLTVNGKNRRTRNLSLWNSRGGKYNQRVDNAGGVITGGYSTNKAGGIHIEGGARVTLNEVTVAGNRAEQNWGSDGYGGGIWACGSDVQLCLNNSIVTGNYAYNDGGGIYSNGSLFGLYMVGSRVDYNYAKRDGGGIATTKDDTMISGDAKTTVSGNSCGGSDGGGIYATGETTIKGFTVADNTSPKCGGGIFIKANSGISDLVIRNNKSGEGGGVYFGWIMNKFFMAAVSISGCTITGNNVTKNTTWGKGAGVYMAGGVSGKNGDAALSIGGASVIKDNGNGAGNLVVGFNSFANIELSRGSEVHLGYKSISGSKKMLTHPDSQVTNCIQYVHSENNGYRVTYKDSERKMYLATSSAKDAGKAAGDYDKHINTVTITPEQAAPKVVSNTYKSTYGSYPIIRGYIRYPSFEDTANELASPFYYSDGYFADDPNIYNTHLATCSLSMAMSGFYLNGGGTIDYTNKHASARQFMADIGCDEQKTYVNNFNVQKPGTGTIGITIGYKQLKLKDRDRQDKEYYLIPIAVRGAGYESEWASNVTLGDGTNPLTGTEAQGFGTAANQVTEEVSYFLAKNGLLEKDKLKKVKLWVVGYSRAGATANMTSKRLIDLYGDKAEVFGYTFEAPQGGTDTAELDKKPATKYYTIHNTINYADLVALVGPSKMTFKRYGVDHYVPGSSANRSPKYSGSDPTVYSDNEHVTTSEKGEFTSQYQEEREKMLAQLAAVDPSLHFDDYFAMQSVSNTLSVSALSPKDQKNAETFIRTLIDKAQEYVIPSRSDYASKYQTAFAQTMAAVFGMSDANARAFMDRAMSVSGRIDYIFGANSGLNLLIKVATKWPKMSYKEKKAIADGLLSKVEASGAFDYLSPSDASKLRSNAPALVDFIGMFLNKEIGTAITLKSKNRLTLSMSAAGNLMRLMQNHYPEVNLAWARAQDSYYANETTTHTRIAAASSVDAPKAKAGDTKVEAGRETRLPGKQSIMLDVDNIKGEAIYYQLLDKDGKVISKNTCKNGYDIYRGPIELNIKPESAYTIKAYAIYHATRSGEAAFFVNGGLALHKVTLVDTPGAKPVTEELEEGTNKTISVKLDSASDKWFEGWMITDERGQDITRWLIKRPLDYSATFKMPIGGQKGYTKNYEIKIEAKFKDKPKAKAFWINYLDLPRINDDADNLKKKAKLSWITADSGVPKVDVDVAWEKTETSSESPRTVDWKATISIPSKYDSQFIKDVKAFVYTGREYQEGVKVPGDDVSTVRNNDGSITVTAQFHLVEGSGTPIEHAPETFTVNATAYDANAGAPLLTSNGGNPGNFGLSTSGNLGAAWANSGEITVARVIEKDGGENQQFTATPPVVEGGVFSGWEIDAASADKIEVVEGKSNTFQVRNGVDLEDGTQLGLHALFIPVVSKVEVALGAPVAEKALPEPTKLGVTLANTSFSAPDVVLDGGIAWNPAHTEAAESTAYDATLNLRYKKKGENAAWRCVHADGAEVEGITAGDLAYVSLEIPSGENAPDATVHVYYDVTETLTHSVFVLFAIDNDSVSKWYEWREGSVHRLAAADTDTRYFDYWKVSAKNVAENSDVAQLLRVDTNDPGIAFTMPKGTVDGPFYIDYKELGFIAIYANKASNFTVNVEGPATPTQDASGLADKAKLAWTNITSSSEPETTELNDVPVTWSREAGDVTIETDKVYQKTTYKATMQLDAAHARKLTANAVASGTGGAQGKTVDTKHNADGSITVTVTFETEEGTGMPLPQDPLKYNVNVVACDVNDADHAALKDASGQDVAETYVIEEDDEKRFVVAAPDVDGGVFCGWEIVNPEEVERLKDQDEDEVVPVSEFKLKDDVQEEGQTFTIKALYKPIIGTLTVTLAEPVSAEPLAKLDAVAISATPAKAAFSAIAPKATALTWDPEPEDGKADYDTAYVADIALGDDPDEKQFAYDENTKVEWKAPAGGLSGQSSSDGSSGAGPAKTAGAMGTEDADGSNADGDDAPSEVTASLGANMEDGTMVASIFFDETDLEPLNLLHVKQPDSVSNVSNGAEPKDYLPKTTTLVLTGGASIEAEIKWGDLLCIQAGDDVSESIWYAEGTVDLTDVNNPEKLSNKVHMYIFVDPPEADERVHAEEPYPSIDPGLYEFDQAIYLSTDEEDGVIYYTLDPTGDNFVEYTGEPIMLTRDEGLLGEDDLLVIRAFTRVAGKEDSAIAGFVYGLDNIISIPDDGELTFNGESQIGVWGSTCYTLEGVRVAEDEQGSLETADGVDENGDASATNAGTYLVTAKINDGLVWRLDPIEDDDAGDGGLTTQADDADDAGDYSEYGVNTTTDDQQIVIKVAPASIEDCEIGAVADQVYDGKEKTPEPTVVFADMTLEKDKDYTLSYKDNVELGTATVTITGKGNFTDSATIEFKIVTDKKDDPEEDEGDTPPDNDDNETPDKDGKKTPVAASAKTPSTGDIVGIVPVVIAVVGVAALAAIIIAWRRRSC